MDIASNSILRSELMAEIKGVPDDTFGDCFFYRKSLSADGETVAMKALFLKQVLLSISKKPGAVLIRDAEGVYWVEIGQENWIFCLNYEQAKVFHGLIYQGKSMKGIS